MAFLLVEAGLLALAARQAIPRAIQRADATDAKLDKVLEALPPAIDDIHNIQVDTTRTEAEMAGLLNQTRRSLLTPEQTKELVDRAANLMDNANESVIRLGAAAQSLEGIGPTTQGAIAQTAQDIHITAGDAEQAIDTITKEAGDPAIHETLTHVEGVAGNLDATSADLKKIADQWAAPVRGVWNHLKIFAFEIAGPAAQVATAIR